MKSEIMPTKLTTFFVVLVDFVFSEWSFCIAASEILSQGSNFRGGKTGIVRGRPIPIPGPGMQLTNISHARDLSSMLTLAVENPAAASGNIFNCVSDRAVTLDGMARLCAKAAGRDVNIVHYDPKTVGVDAKKAFPFRTYHFYAEPRAAKEILGWKGTTNLPEDLKERFEEYVKIGRDKKPLEFPMDDKILESLKVPVAV